MAGARGPAGNLAHELDAVDARVGEVTVRLSCADALHALHEPIALVRRRLGGAGVGRPRSD